MFDKETLKRAAEPVQYVRPEFMLEHFSVAELLDLRSKIDEKLPAKSLGDVNLERELLNQYALVKELQASVIQNDMIPPNQRAQVAAQVAATLQKLVELQESLSREEEFKRMESALIDAVAELPQQAREKFFEDYQSVAKRHGL